MFNIKVRASIYSHNFYINFKSGIIYAHIRYFTFILKIGVTWVLLPWFMRLYPHIGNIGLPLFTTGIPHGSHSDSDSILIKRRSILL